MGLRGAFAIGAILACLACTDGGPGPAASPRSFLPGTARWERIADFPPLSGYIDIGRAAFFTPARGLALGKPGHRVLLLRTGDGGLHWDTLHQDTAWSLESVAAADDSIGYLAFSQSDPSGPPRYGVLQTRDAGLTWRRLTHAGDSDMALFHAGRSPLVLVDRDPQANVDFLLSTDAGLTWREWSPAARPFAPEHLLRTRPIHAYAQGRILAGAYALNWVDFATGAVTRHLTFPDSLAGPEHGPALEGPGWIVYGDFRLDGEALFPMVAQSRDGGAAWDTLPASRPCRMRDVKVRGASGLAFGDCADSGGAYTAAAIWLTQDGGGSWTESFDYGTRAPIVEAVWAAPGVCYGFDGTAVWRLRP